MKKFYKPFHLCTSSITLKQYNIQLKNDPRVYSKTKPGGDLQENIMYYALNRTIGGKYFIVSYTQLHSYNHGCILPIPGIYNVQCIEANISTTLASNNKCIGHIKFSNF